MKYYQGTSTQEAIIMEMSATPETQADVDVPVDKDVIAKLKEGDSEPMFVTIEVLNEGVSRNGRAWDKKTILSVAEQINAKKPDGYYGHLTEEERKSKYPEPQTIWVGAKTLEIDGKLRLFAKGYVLPDAKKLRTYLTKAKAIGKNVAVSVYGTAQAIKDKVKNVITMKDFDLESVDWARPGSEGVRNMGIFSVTSEMTEDGDNDNYNEVNMKREDVLKTVTADELQEHNPTLVSEMTSEVVSSKETELEALVAEMKQVEEVLDIESISSAVDVIGEMREKLTEYEIDAELKNKVDSASARKFVRQLVVSEMSDGHPVDVAVDRVLESETGKSIVEEMVDAAPRVAPATKQPVQSTRKFTKK